LDNDTGFSRNIVGVNFWPVPDVVLKLDYINQESDAGVEENSLNLGIGYQF